MPRSSPSSSHPIFPGANSSLPCFDTHIAFAAFFHCIRMSKLRHTWQCLGQEHKHLDSVCCIIWTMCEDTYYQFFLSFADTCRNCNLSWVRNLSLLVFPVSPSQDIISRTAKQHLLWLIIFSISFVGLPVTIYNGQLDLICSTLGLNAWLPKLKWSGLANFSAALPKPLHATEDPRKTTGFLRQHENLSLYIILNAGHMIPSDQPVAALDMVKRIISHGLAPSNRQKQTLA